MKWVQNGQSNVDYVWMCARERERVGVCFVGRQHENKERRARGDQ